MINIYSYFQYDISENTIRNVVLKSIAENEKRNVTYRMDLRVQLTLLILGFSHPIIILHISIVILRLLGSCCLPDFHLLEEAEGKEHTEKDFSRKNQLRGREIHG